MKETHPDLFYATSTIQDGNMSCKYGVEEEVIENRQEFLKQLGVSLEDCVMMDLNHGDDVAVVSTSHKGTAMGSCAGDGIQGDAFITDTRGIYLFMLTGDCVPLTLYDPDHGVVALVHLSRMTTNARLTQKTLDLMGRRWKTKSESILAWSGPSISRDSYKLDYFNESDQGWADFTVELPDGRMSVDVSGFNHRQLLDAGVNESNINISDVDTFVSSDYFSQRRARATGEKEGRFATVVGLVK